MHIDEERYIYRASIRLRNGKRIIASRYGKRAFKIKIRRDVPPKQLDLPGID